MGVLLSICCETDASLEARLGKRRITFKWEGTPPDVVTLHKGHKVRHYTRGSMVGDLHHYELVSG